MTSFQSYKPQTINSPDYIILGAGCAGLSLAMRMAANPFFSKKNILLIEKGAKASNDRTWCFWEKGTGFFEKLVYRQWDQLDFFSSNYSKELDISPYHYKMIRGIDFYKYCIDELRKQNNISIKYGDVQSVTKKNGDHIITIDGIEMNAGKAIVFNSIYHPGANDTKTIRLLQHFKGRVIETAKPCFDPARATMMDFRVSQQGTTFAYLLPFTATTALVEYTLFTKELLEPAQYDKGLDDYIDEFIKPGEYTTKEEEFGVIPMTSESFPFYKEGIYYIGTAGGQTKASTGYTFRFIQKQSEKIIEYLVNGKSLQAIKPAPRRFRFYDNTLLYILYHGKLQGSDIFSKLFKKNKPQHVLRFLDNESSLFEELKIISSLPAIPFLKAALLH